MEQERASASPRPDATRRMQHPAMPSDLPSPPPSTATRPHRFLATRFISRPVRNSLTRRAIKHVCSIFLSLSSIAAVLLFVLWLALRPHRPRFHVSSFSATGHSAPGNGLAFTFDVAIRNPNREVAIYYDPMSAYVYYRDDRVGSSGKPVSGPFDQPPKNTTAVSGEAAGVAPRAAAEEIAGEASTGSVGFRLELTSIIRFSVSTFDTHRHHLHVSCDVEVGGADGIIVAGSKDRRCSIYFL